MEKWMTRKKGEKRKEAAEATHRPAMYLQHTRRAEQGPRISALSFGVCEPREAGR